MRIAKIIGIAAIVLVLLAAAVPFFINANQFRPLLESRLTEALGRQVRIGNLKVSLFSGGVTADDLSIADDSRFSRAPFLQSKSLSISVELVPLIFSHRLNITGLTVSQPVVALLQTDAGDWNFSSLGTKSEAPASGQTGLQLSLKQVKINGGQFSMGRSGTKAKPLVLTNAAIELRDFSADSVFPFSVTANVAGGGQINLTGKAGPLNSTDAALTPLLVNLKISLDLASSGVVDPATGMAGIASLEAQADSDGRTAHASGRLRAEKMRLVKTGSAARRPVEFDFALEHDLRKRSGVLRRGNLHFGSAPAALTGNYSLRPDATVWNLVFSGPEMAVPELVEFLPALDIVLPAGSSLQSGTAGAKLAMEGTANRLITTGSVGLSNTRLAGFSLGAKMAAIERLAGIPGGPNTEIQSFHANLRMSPEGTSVDALELIVPSIGNLSGGGTISPSHALDFRMRTTLHTSGTVMAALGQKGDTNVPFLITGTSSDPVFRPDVRGIAEEKIEHFTNKSGLGKAAGDLLNGLFGKKKD